MKTEPIKMKYNDIKTTAIKNLIARFFRDNLKMDDMVRDNLQIEQIFPSRTEESDIMYIKCKTTEDINEITSLVRNLSHSTNSTTPSNYQPHPKNYVQKVQTL